MRPFRLAIAIVLLLAGLVWLGQGAGLVGGSVMNGQAIWALIGALLVVAAAALVWTAARRARWALAA